MAPITSWGPATWTFLHTTIQKIKPEHYKTLGPQFFAFFVRICNNLPCPTCTEHAKGFINGMLRNNKFLNDKNLFINAIYIFHNQVNKRLNKQMYHVGNLENYKSKNLINTFNNFSKNFHSDGSLNLIASNFHRQRLKTEIKKWLILNLNKFEN